MSQRRLTQLRRVANKEADLASRKEREALDHAVWCGEALIEAKSLVNHGEWLPWLKENFEKGQDTAAHYMRLAANSDRIPNFKSINEALAHLTTESQNEKAKRKAKEHLANTPPGTKAPRSNSSASLGKLNQVASVLNGYLDHVLNDQLWPLLTGDYLDDADELDIEIIDESIATIEKILGNLKAARKRYQSNRLRVIHGEKK